MDRKVKWHRTNNSTEFGLSKSMPDNGKSTCTKHQFPRLMEKTNLDARRSKNMSWYDDPRSAYRHNADYLKRLSSLRDNLIDQEQTNLVHAIERLRSKQTRESLQSKAKAKNAFEVSETNNKKFITTLEKFKQSRPKRYPPELHPLEGKQLIEPLSSRSPQSIPEKSGSATSVTRPTEENIIRNNLQRLIAPITPTSSIPNIGRKSQKSIQQLVLDTSPLQRKKTCFSADHAEKNPFKNIYRGARTRKVMRPDVDDLELSPNAVKFEKIGDHDKINIDKLKEYYCIYYLPSNTPTGQDEFVSEDDENNGSDVSNGENTKFDNQLEHELKPNDMDLLSNRFPNEQYRYKAGYFGASQRVPERKPMLHPVTGKALVTNTEDIRKHRLRKLHLSDSVNNIENDAIYGNEEKDGHNRKQIVVDMPSLVFNAATPEGSDLETRTAFLSKAYKQNELRHRELKNLLDDVKELNKRTDDLSERASSDRSLEV
ncbi:uncharacterized protein LOC143059573 isoform X2 [Mytilus galloprovincialis]|uniref:uncharacterized protein LOC143059573 isoform X2 n=1 Tax=Mytilus galloprovincialis TaxID=29158 RepID=UPI003F7C7E67